MNNIATDEKHFIKVETELLPENINKYVDYLLTNPNAKFYHHPYWLMILAKESGQSYYYIVCYNSLKKISGILPILKTKGFPFDPVAVLSSKRLSALPRTPYSGPVADDDLSYSMLLHAAIKLGEGNPEYLLQIKSLFQLDAFNPKIRSIQWRKTNIKEIPTVGESLFFNKETLRDINRSIKKAKENNLIFREATTLEELKNWYIKYLKTMRFHSVPARSFNFFKTCWEFLRPYNLLELNLVGIESGKSFHVLAGSFDFKFKDFYYGGFKGSDRRSSSLRINDFLLYNELVNMQENGIKYCDFGEVPGDHRQFDSYKKKWGVEQFQIFHNYYGAGSTLIGNKTRIKEDQ